MLSSVINKNPGHPPWVAEFNALVRIFVSYGMTKREAKICLLKILLRELQLRYLVQKPGFKVTRLMD